MLCLKCGKETDEGRTFCGSCMEDMEKYPVKPGTPVLLPTNSNAVPNRKTQPRKRSVPNEKEQIAKLKRRIRLLATLLLIVLAALTAVTVLYVRGYFKTPVRPTGQNYSTVSAETIPQT